MSRRVVVTLVVASAGVAVLQAQERIELLTRVGASWNIVQVDASVNGFGAVGVPTGIAIARVDAAPLTLAGARYVIIPAVQPDGRGLVVFDRRTRTSTAVRGLIPDSEIRATAVDPVQPRLFISGFRFDQIPIGVWMVDARTVSATRIVDGTELGPLAYAADTDILFVGRHASGTTSVDAVRVGGSGSIQRFTLGYLFMTSMTVDRAGRRLWVTGASGPRTSISLLDAATGQELRRTAVGADQLILDEPRGLILAPLSYVGLLQVLDANSLATIAVLKINGPPPFNVQQGFDTLPGRWMTGAYAVRVAEAQNGSACFAINVDVYDPDGTRRASADVLRHLPSGTSCAAYPALVRSPFAPAALAADVVGQRVTLSWRTPGDVTEFEIQAGPSPGTTVLSQRVGTNTAMTFDHVPPGTYYVRVRAFNEIGGSPVSNEIRVEVH